MRRYSLIRTCTTVGVSHWHSQLGLCEEVNVGMYKF